MEWTRIQHLQILSDTENTITELNRKYKNYEITLEKEDIKQLLILKNIVQNILYKAEVKNVR